MKIEIQNPNAKREAIQKHISPVPKDAEYFDSPLQIRIIPKTRNNQPTIGIIMTANAQPRTTPTLNFPVCAAWRPQRRSVKEILVSCPYVPTFGGILAYELKFCGEIYCLHQRQKTASFFMISPHFGHFRSFEARNCGLIGQHCTMAGILIIAEQYNGWNFDHCRTKWAPSFLTPPFFLCFKGLIALRAVKGEICHCSLLILLEQRDCSVQSNIFTLNLLFN